MFAAAVGIQVRRHAMKRQTSRGPDQNRLSGELHACLKPVLCVSSFADRDQELANLLAASSVPQEGSNFIIRVANCPSIKLVPTSAPAAFQNLCWHSGFAPPCEHCQTLVDLHLATGTIK